MSLKTQVIVNPESNRGRTRRRWTQIKEALNTFLKEFKYEFTEKPTQAIDISRTAIREGSELIVGVGGDGTINEIANGFFDGKNIINPKTVMGIVPSGTGCDFIRSLHIPTNLKSALTVITQAPSPTIDVGRARFLTRAGTDEERYFLNVADFGFGGEVLERMNQNRAKRKAASYLKSTLATFFHYKNKRIKLRIDGEEIPRGEYLIGAISNGKIFGKGMKIAPNARLDDELFDIILVKGMKIWEFLRNVWKIYAGTHLSHPKIAFIQGKKIEAVPEDPDEDILIEIDGEQVGKLPATFEIVPKSISVKGYV
jgi:YegS/Rv2252/BmrU family lipid kinase